MPVQHYRAQSLSGTYHLHAESHRSFAYFHRVISWLVSEMSSSESTLYPPSSESVSENESEDGAVAPSEVDNISPAALDGSEDLTQSSRQQERLLAPNARPPRKHSARPTNLSRARPRSQPRESQPFEAFHRWLLFCHHPRYIATCRYRGLFAHINAEWEANNPGPTHNGNDRARKHGSKNASSGTSTERADPGERARRIERMVNRLRRDTEILEFVLRELREDQLMTTRDPKRSRNSGRLIRILTVAHEWREDLLEYWTGCLRSDNSNH